MSGSVTQVYEVPLSPSAQSLTIALNGTNYQLTFVYREVDALADPNGFDGGSWCLDLATSAGVSILAGVPLTTGTDLLSQFGYLQLGFSLFVTTDGDPLAVPTYETLGQTSHLLYIVNPST